MADSLWQAYEQTVYRIGHPRKLFDLQVDDPFPIGLQEWGYRRLAVITAWNPASVRTPFTENQKQNRKLADQLKKRSLEFCPAIGIALGASTWLPEESFCVFSIDCNAALELARMFAQKAILYADVKHGVRLLACT